MTIGLWTVSGIGVSKLDTTQKTEGLSSLLMYGTDTTIGRTLERKYFACQSFRVEYWIRVTRVNGSTFKLNASEYGSFPAGNGLYNTVWTKRRMSFLWDASTESKWMRFEQWDGSSWYLLQGDTALGDTPPANSTFSMISTAWSLTSLMPVNIDEMTCEVLA